MEIVGKNNNYILFSHDGSAVVIDSETNETVKTGTLSSLVASAKWDTTDTTADQAAYDLAHAELTTLDIGIVSSAGRMYTIPKGAQAEAIKALEWRKEHKRGGTSVGVNTARTLAKGGQIGIEKVRHIAKYFPRHAVDKKAKGYQPGEQGFPSNGRIAWALWGGDTAWKWAQQIVERENKKALKADGYVDAGYVDDVATYSTENDYNADIDVFTNQGSTEFIARVRMDGSGIDRLYKVDEDLSVAVWDSGHWHSLPGVDNDLTSYDMQLDDEFGSIDTTHVEIDNESAFFLSACFQEEPNKPVSLFDVNYEEAQLLLNAAAELDFEFIDRALTAAGKNEFITSTPAAPSSPASPADGVYTPDERSKNASKQVRDATGRFSQNGSRVVIGGDAAKGSGNIVAIDPVSQSVTVRLDSGANVTVPANTTQPEANVAPVTTDVQEVTPLDTSGILGEPRAPIDEPGAKIPGTLPRFAPEDIAKVLYDFPGYVNEQRNSFNPNLATPSKVKVGEMPNYTPQVTTGKADKQYEKSDFLKNLEKLTGTKLVTDPYTDPRLSSFLNKKVTGADGKTYYPNKKYYQPIVAPSVRGSAEKQEIKPTAAKPATGKAVELTPETSDIQPLFFAIVAEDDPGAVLDLVSLIPASTESTDPVAYTRENKAWKRNDDVLRDINSPTPPPVVPLDAETLASVIKQVDGIEPVAASAKPDEDFLTLLWGPNGNVMVMTAAGGPDRNRGNAERLRIYWTRGKGAAKIRWGTKGDWSRCVRHLSKYLGPRAKGYCQLRHKDALGYYTSTHAKMDKGRHNSANEFMEQPFDPLTMEPMQPAFTEVTDEDMKMPLEAVHIIHDDLYDHHWEPEEDIISLLKDHDLMDMECDTALVSAGGLDKNRGNAEQLRRYWTVGKGGLKIRWNSPGDWTRCFRHLKKYMGPRAKGYCSLRHKEMTGMWPGDKRNPGMKNAASFSVDGILSYDEVMEASYLSAKAADARRRVLTASGEEIQVSGGKFMIPLVLPEEHESGDGRSFAKDSIEIRELPLPLMWQIKSAEGHNGSVVVGRIDHMERIDGGIGNATGVFDSGEYGQEAERLVREGFIRGISADLDQFEASEQSAEDNDNELEQDSGKIGTDKLVISHARVMAVTLVPKPAFQECQIYLVNDEKQEDTMIQDGVYVDDMDPVEASALVACGMVAGAIPVTPPSDWFNNPRLKEATPLTVDDEGRVFGHIAAWHVDHIGMSFGTRPPRSKSKYAYFHTGVVRTQEGKDIPVGQLTLAGGHASLEASAAEAVRHYDDTASAIADVHAGEDAFGIWVAGALRPGTTPEQIRALRASAPSGDWRPVKGNLELVAVCQVNVPGFPIARARVASGAVMALVAAGANVLARMKSDPVAELSARIEKLEQLENTALSAKAAEARARFEDAKEQHAAELSAIADAAYERIHGEPRYDDAFAFISREKRQKLAKEGKALPDGSFPITSAEGVKDAIHAYGRAKPGKRAAVRRHIEKMARKYDMADAIPAEWKTLSSASIEEDVADLRARVASFSAEVADDLGKALAVEVKDQGKYTPETQPRDEKGKFRDVLARIKQNLGTSGTQAVMDQLKETEKLDNAGNYVEAAQSGAKLISIIDRIDSKALNPQALENVRESARELGKVIANLPFDFGSDTEKVRYSDLPPALKDLIDDMITRTEAKIGKKDADEATTGLKSFMSGGDYFTQTEISSQLSKLLRLLT